MVQPWASGSLGWSVLLLLSAPPLGQAMGERMLVATRLESATGISTSSRGCGRIEHVETAGAGGAPLPASNTEPLAAQQRQTSSSTLPAVGGSAIFCATPRTETSTVAVEARALCSSLGGGGGGATPNARSTHRPALGAEDSSRWAAPKLQSRI